MTSDALPPTWVTKRDGSQVPFDADTISRSLFAATESLGQPDAFLARELTDGVVHFLSVEQGDRVPTTEIAELVVKVVRELGQPALAEAYAAPSALKETSQRRQTTASISRCGKAGLADSTARGHDARRCQMGMCATVHIADRLCP